MQNTYVKDSALLDYDVGFYWIDIEVSDTSTFVRGNTSVHARAVKNIDELVFELSTDHRIDSIIVNGIKQSSFRHEDDLIRIDLPSSISGEFRACIYYEGTGGQNSFFAGISNRLDYWWNKRVTYTLSESFNAHDWFVCKQVLTDKADSAYIFLTTPDRLKAGSNGILSGIDSLSGNRLKYKWKTRYPIAYYLLSLSVAAYQDYSFYVHLDSGNDSMLVQNYIYDDPACLAAYKDDIDRTSEMLEFYSKIFGKYPFREEKYGHSLAPIGGGMEHQTMTTLYNFNFTLVAHELVHQWFGDNVTCASWQDIWINEGFASYGEYLALQSLVSQQAADSWMADAFYRALSVPDGSVYVPSGEAESESRIFSGALSYKKGATLLHMLRNELADDTVFFEVLRNFQEEFRDSTATAEDFLDVLDQTSSGDYAWFFDQWYYGAGYPVHKINWWTMGEDLFLHCEQEGSSSATTLFRLGMDIRIEFTDGHDTLVRLDIDKNIEQFDFWGIGEVSDILADPSDKILDKSTTIQRHSVRGEFHVSPNPFTDRINLLFEKEASREISLADMNGRIVQRWNTLSNDVSLQARDIGQGVYLLQVKEGRETYTAKIVKQ